MRALAAFALTIVTLVPMPAAARAFDRGLVTTAFGDGVAGNDDGSSTVARFMAPDGMAFDSMSGITYVSDFAGQRIRMIDAAGIVTTVAGIGSVAPSGLDVAGAYVDGSTRIARFNHPTGIAIGIDGAIYVSDSFNRCIRKIVNGMVSTVAGIPGSSQALDGEIGSATFIEPRGLAIGRDGTIYVADLGKGIRIVRPRSISTITDISETSIESLSLSQPDGRYLYYSSPSVVGRYDLMLGRDERFAKSTPLDVDPWWFADILPIDSDTVILTDVETDAILTVSFACHDIVARCAHVFSGGLSDDASHAGGYVDGELRTALFFTPLGMAKIDATTIEIADSSNRRIRKLTWTSP